MPVPGPIDPRKVPRNARCPCGSGKKFKKCCLRMLEDIAPLARAQAEKAQRAKFEAPPSISTMFKGKRVRALGSRVLLVLVIVRATFALWVGESSDCLSGAFP